MLLENRVAIITGGAKGMGKGTALKFAQEGCTVAIADISMDDAKNTIAEITQKGGQGVAFQCDVTNSVQVKDTVDQVIKKYKKIDILVNNAGAAPLAQTIETVPEEQWNKFIDLNLKSDFLFCKYIVPFMKEKRYGKIVNISSIGAIHPPSHVTSYNAAKAGVLGFTYDLAFALGPFNINVNAILPGPIRTDFYKERLAVMPNKDEFFTNMAKKVPLQRMGTPEDIANAALFLSSEMASFITGTTLLVAGGLPLPVNMAALPPQK